MTRLIVLMAALACVAAAPAKAPVKPAAPVAAKPASRAVATPTPAAPFDSQNPQTLIDLLSRSGAQAETARRDEDSLLVVVKSTAANFSVQFAGCDRAGKKCQGALFDDPESGVATLSQVNAFNQSSLNCRIYLDRTPQAHVVYSALLLWSDNRETFEVHLAAWQGCIVEGRNFLRDPAGYLAKAA